MENSLNILRPSDLADMLGVSRVTIWRMGKRGELPPKKKFSNRCTGWTEKTIVEWFDSRPYADPEAEQQRQSNLEPA